MAISPIYSAAISGLGAILGGGSAPDYSQVNQYQSQLKDIGNQYGQLSQPYNANSAGDANSARQATTAEAAYLNQNPWTNQQDAQYLARSTQGASDAYSKAAAALAANLGARGLSPNSSAAVGGQEALAANQASTMANADQNLAFNQQAQHASNVAALTNLYNNQANNDFSKADAGLNSQQGVDQSLSSTALQEAQGNYQAQQANDAANGAAWGSFGNSLGNVDWSNPFGKKSGTVSTPSG